MDRNRRVVLAYWKKRERDQFEVYSNLKNFCLSYPEYNYNTLNNYLSKEKIAFENELVRIERKSIITKPVMADLQSDMRAMQLVVRRVKMKEANDEIRDLEYWLSQPVQKRAQAVTFIISQSLKRGQRMDKTVVNRKPMKP